jgi:hypothetical protein
MPGGRESRLGIMIDWRGYAPEGMEMKKILIVIIILLTSLPLVASEGFSTLEEQMTGKEFTASGLDKLTPDELASLNAWIRRRSLATIDAPAAAPAAAATTTATTSSATESTGGDRRGFRGEKEEEDRAPITSRIVGKFRGWDGQTVFKLENGMIWEQADNDKFYIREVEDAVAIIEPGFFGTWRLHIDGYNSKCRVERIQ